MQISSIQSFTTTNGHPNLKKTNFKSKETFVKVTEQELKHIQANGFGLGTIIGGFLALIICAFAADRKSDSDKTIEKFEELIQTNVFNNNLEIQDINEDGVSDFVFTQKDGTKVIYDSKNKHFVNYSE